MAPMKPTSENGLAPTRPRLQAVNQNFSDLNEQIRQVAHIIGLPDSWATVEDEGARSDMVRQLVRARAEWVLRWVLDKLKDEAEAGHTARANTTAWKLLDWMIHVLPVSRSAPHLRDAAFTTILERTLVEMVDKDAAVHSVPISDDVHMADMSESSETVGDDSQPSRKRKRGAADSTSPSKRAAVASIDLEQLFSVIATAVRSITGLAATHNKTDDSSQRELMKMVLRTESAQASRILKFWLTCVQKLAGVALSSGLHAPNLDRYLDLSLALEVWELRTVDSGDEMGSSADEFTTECLVPALTLLDALKSTHNLEFIPSSTRSINRTTQAIEKLLARHLLAPSRAAFFAETLAESANPEPSPLEAKQLADSLQPLRAKLLQAAQIEDAGEAVPADVACLSNAVSHLLDLAIRASPSKTPRSRIAEKPWIQAVFVTLVECAGCSLKEPPEFVTSNTAVTALGSAVRVLQIHNISIKSDVLKNIFWYHSGVKYPKNQEKEVHWSLIAALIELDPTVFVAEPKSISGATREQHTGLAQFIFEQISNTEFKSPGFANDDRDADGLDNSHTGHRAQTAPRVQRTLILKRIVVPIMSAFARNRNLLGFLGRWDNQLVKSYRFENRQNLKERKDLIWEDRTLNKALVELFEQSLTQGQIAKLLQDHAKRMDDLGDAIASASKDGVKVQKLAAYKNALSSAIIIPAILQSIGSDEIIGALKPQLRSLLRSYTAWVQDDQYSVYSKLALSWFTLCQLLTKLWPIELHASAQIQEELLHPLVKQATVDMSSTRKDQNGRRVDSFTRAAAMLFLLDACDYLQTVPGSTDLIQTSLQKTMESLSASRIDLSDFTKLVEYFCADFVQLFGHLEAEACQKLLLTLLSKLSNFDSEVGEHISHSLSQTIFQQGSSSLQDTYSSALLQTLEKNEDNRAHAIAVKSFLHMSPLALSRERREAILDRITELLASGSKDSAALLSIVAHLMEVSNATAKISTEGGLAFKIAETLHKQGLESPASLQSLQHLVQLTLGHIFPNQGQPQNQVFLGEFRIQVGSVTKKKAQCSAAQLVILRAAVSVQKQNALIDLERYVAVLKQCLADDSGSSASLQDVLDALNELSPLALQEAKLFDTTQAWLRTWINDNADLESYITSEGESPAELAEYVARLQTAMARYSLHPNATWLVKLTFKLVREPIADEMKETAFETVKHALAPLPIPEKLDLIPVLADVQDPLNHAASYRLLNILISTLDDKLEMDPQLRHKQLALLPKICVLLASCADHPSSNALLTSINTILDSKPSLASQHSIETVLSVLVKLSSRSSPALPATHAPLIYSRLCETSRLILLLHRGRLGGRFHLVLPLLQSLLFCLFTPNHGRTGALPPWLRSASLPPTSATQYSRILLTLCNPPQSSVKAAHHPKKSKDLNDPVKAAREYTSHFLYPLLAAFCKFQLGGRLEAGVREKLMPGVWEAVGTAGVHREGLDAMFAGMGRSEKDVWRGVWSEWEGVHGRKRVVGEEA
ncbi:hypothetical protein P153DRAFT_433697 [Dothidotthia symphoricarpi CBS 119687]|uniref:Nucleolar 27S pre-rRNA processing Urb2/Npa2 C-terminal domain-containing protein n=1 Tax=Dothidotthia symphoricarpi CBS 119687 TaxID=1392245 RepID=A0A6A6A7F7_9PLEO|nr:uncharacterized protein P153DRAFT_433697 [Dothidotthia symphoricarpi CBS 119687]KAF2126571.1 hypothetical protein P153DRAFT_433697 [Dothidotthia symphoricarpi CBS 119687]